MKIQFDAGIHNVSNCLRVWARSPFKYTQKLSNGCDFALEWVQTVCNHPLILLMICASKCKAAWQAHQVKSNEWFLPLNQPTGQSVPDLLSLVSYTSQALVLIIGRVAVRLSIQSIKLLGIFGFVPGQWPRSSAPQPLCHCVRLFQHSNLSLFQSGKLWIMYVEETLMQIFSKCWKIHHCFFFSKKKNSFLILTFLNIVLF